MEKEFRKKLSRFAQIFKEAQDQGKREADTVMYITEFIHDVLQYDIFKEISKEYQVKEKYCDIAIKLDGQVIILVEAKPPGLKLVDRHIEQVENYAMRSGTEWAILTNGCEWRLYHLSFSDDSGVERALVFKTDLLNSFIENPADVISKLLLLHRKSFLKGELSKPISGLKAGAFGQEDEWPTLRSGMPFIPRLKSLGFSGMTYKYWKKKNLLTPQSLLSALFTKSVLKTISRELNRGEDVRVGIDDIERELKNMLDKGILADLADVKLNKKKRAKRLSRKPKPPVAELSEEGPAAVTPPSTPGSPLKKD